VLTRRRLLAGAAALAGLQATAGCTLLLPDAGPARPYAAVPTSSAPLPPPRVLPPLRGFRGVDLSSLLLVEAAGWTFTDGGRTGPVEELTAARGADLVRLRLWVDPRPGSSGSQATALTLARRANAAGCHVLLALHYADTWADPYTQPTPAAWAGQDLTRLAETVRTYTRETVTAFAAQGTPPALVQIGNEVSAGLLWPTGQVVRGTRAEWDRVATLLAAGIRGAQEAGSGDLRTVLHSDIGGDAERAAELFRNVIARGASPDVLGLSFFPWWHGTLSDLQTNLNGLARRFDRPVAVVETAYPWCVPVVDTRGVNVAELHVRRADQLPEARRFPPTPQGQAAFLTAMRGVVAAVPNGLGLGVVAWEPAWMPGIGPDGAPGPNRFASMTLFDWEGRGLPALEVLRP
jgi:arabinogalactan endo-1,4-beta-galactosidase